MQLTRPTPGKGAFFVASAGHAAFAAMMIALGIWGLVKGGFVSTWAPVPKGIPGRAALAYLCAVVSLLSGVGLVVRRTAAIASRVLLAAYVLWFLAWRVRFLFVASLIEGTWSCAETLAMMAAAWVLYAWFAKGFATGERGVRIARVLFGLAMIPFGYAHVANLQGTTSLVPGWLPWHLFWAYFTGIAFFAAGVAILVGVWAHLAAALVTLQMGLFGLLVWVPRVATGRVSEFQWGEFVVTFALTAAGWVVTDSYRATPGIVSANAGD